jgi:nitroreductase
MAKKFARELHGRRRTLANHARAATVFAALRATARYATVRARCGESNAPQLNRKLPVMQTITAAQLLEALRWRYATKMFDPARRIPANVWDELEGALVLTPSSFGLQPYRFLVVEDKALRAKLLPHSWGQKQVVEASHFVVFVARTSIDEAEIDALIQRTCDVRGVTRESLAGYRSVMTGMLLSEGFKPRVPHWAAHQAYIALGNLMTAAAVVGVDACPMEGIAPAEYDKLLGLEGSGFATVVACALGYRASGDKYATLPKVRFAAANMVKHL